MLDRNVVLGGANGLECRIGAAKDPKTVVFQHFFSEPALGLGEGFQRPLRDLWVWMG
jgi:hypothetical protein